MSWKMRLRWLMPLFAVLAVLAIYRAIRSLARPAEPPVQLSVRTDPDHLWRPLPCSKVVEKTV